MFVGTKNVPGNIMILNCCLCLVRPYVASYLLLNRLIDVLEKSVFSPALLKCANIFKVYEMWIAGWSFEVLSPIFAIHWGFQSKKSRPAWRERQNNQNRSRFKAFKQEVWARYGKTPPQPQQKQKQ